MRKTRRHDAGFSLLEMLIVIAIASALAMVAFASFRNGDTAAKQSAAESDAQGIAMSVSQIVAPYTGFGTANGTISTNGSGYLVFSNMNSAEPTALGPQTTSVKVALTSGSTMDGTYGSGIPGHWCIHVANVYSTNAVVTDAGPQSGATVCNADGTAA
jgi:prepilin-type N-terminal cleavage/methylation domain-containing protein